MQDVAIQVKSIVSGFQTGPDIRCYETEVSFPARGQNNGVEIQQFTIIELNAARRIFFYHGLMQLNCSVARESEEFVFRYLG